ncbi:uncharacterized protein LOC144126018 [Amblyomma americanum]
MYKCHSGAVSSTHIRASNIITREPYDALAESGAEETAAEMSEPRATSPRNESGSGTDDVLHDVMRQVDAEIRQCLDRGKPLTSIFCSPVKQKGRARRLHRQPFTEHPAAANDCGGPQPSQSHQRPRSGGGSSRCPRAMAAERWLETPHVVSVTRGMSGTQQLQRFDDAARVRQAYHRARWLSRAQRFRIALDVDDPDVQRSLEAVQPFDFQVGPREPPVHIDGIDPDIDEEETDILASPARQC